MNNTNQIVKLIKCSPKCENLLEQIKVNLGDEKEMAAAGLTKFSVTRWTVRATCFQRILDNLLRAVYTMERLPGNKT